ncbi:MAG: tetratricopeptide repeat protein, partial [Bacteroidales bacterium]|nr:tetratricopeptide repeat protein [Bacteroidales bacterium]
MERNKPKLYAALLFCLALLFNQPAVCQQEADSLTALLKKHKVSDSARANLLVSLAEKIRLSDPAQSIAYAAELERMILSKPDGNYKSNKNRYLSAALLIKGRSYLVMEQQKKADSVFTLAIDVWQKANDPNGEAKLLFKIGRNWDLSGKSGKAIACYQNALKIEQSLGNKKDIGINLYHIGCSYDDLSNYRAAEDFTQQAYGQFKEIGDDYRAGICLNNLGNIQNSQGNNPKALEYYLAALKINERIKNELETSNNLNNIGIIYLDMEQYAKARSYFIRAYDLLAKSGNEPAMLYSLGNIGITYSAENNFIKALEYFNRVLKISTEAGDLGGVAMAYNSIARVNEDSGNYPEAIRYYNAAVAINDSMEDKNAMIYNLVGLGDVSRLSGDVVKSAEYLRKARALALEIGALYPEKDALQGLTELFTVTKQYDSAFKYLSLFTSLKDTLLNQENIEEIARKELQYGFDKKMIEEKLLSELEINKQKNRKNIFLFSGLGVLIMAGGLWSRLRYIHKSRAVIQKEKDRSDELLLNILPAEVAEELKEKGFAEARHFDEVTVLFTDFKGFTTMAEQLTPGELVAEIDFCFKKFDEIITRHGIEKIKTIGDAYMCAGGLPVINRTNAIDVVNAALEIQQFMAIMKLERIGENRPYFELRLGIHTGPVVAGIVGIKKFQYDIWGDTVNLASRMESSGEVGKVNISQMTHNLVYGQFECIHRGKIEAKNKG